MNFIEDKIIKKGTHRNLVTRFPPEPNGHLHIGHAKAIVLNFGLAKKYDGIFRLRFDDTNPRVEDEEYERSIRNDVEWLVDEHVEVTHTSNYIGMMIDKAIILIAKGLAFTDTSTSEEIAYMKGTPTEPGTPSPDTIRPSEFHLERFFAMMRGEYKEGEITLRARIDMTSPNMIMRDPILFRIIGNTISPMYDFAHPLSDRIEGVTDSLCTLEFEVHRPLYDWVLENTVSVEKSKPEQTEFNRLSINYTVMSKRKIKYLIDSNIVSGWGDPRLLTLKGLRNRGYTPEIIKDFCEKVGWTKNDTLTDFSLLEASAREILNKKALRIMAVTDPIKLVITNWDPDTTETCEIENNPEDEIPSTRLINFRNELWIEREDFRPEANRKYHRLKIGGEVRLKGAYIVKAESYDLDEDGNITTVYATYDPDTKSGTTDRKVKGTIHWVPCDNCRGIRIINYDRLFTHERPDRLEANDLKLYINDSSMETKSGYIENNLDLIDHHTPVQFLRKGYYKLKPYSGITDVLITFIRTVTLKETWK